MGFRRKGIIIITAIAICLRPLAKSLLWMNSAPPDEDVGPIDFLSTEQLATHVKGKQALLIGGTRGVGYGTALALAKAGAHVTIVGRNENSGMSSVSKILAASSESGSVVEFLQGDIGTVCSATNLVDRLVARNKRYDFAVISAATFPDWTKPLQNEDGIDKSFGIAVVGRYLIYRNMHRFMASNARVLNVLASGEKFPNKGIDLWDRDIASGKRNVSSLFEGILTFGFGNEMMIDSLFKQDEHSTNGEFTMVSTHPGLLKTDLHRGQGFLFDMIEGILVALVGITEENAGVRQASILVSEKLNPNKLTLVDHFGYGRLRCPNFFELTKKHADWLWSFLAKLEEKSTACNL